MGAESQNPSGCARWCPLNSKCVNATACHCSPGFSASSGEIFTDQLESCDDINECGPPLAVSCGKFADCQNTEGSYHCECIPGYELASGGKTFKNKSENTCQDVDECSSGQPVCHNSTVCINTIGAYRCRCRRGWEPKPGFQNMQMNTTCQEMSFPPWTPPPGIQSQRLTSFFKEVQDLRRDFKPALAQSTMENLIKSVDDMLNSSDLEDLPLSERHKMATYLLSELERVLRTLAKAMPGASFTYNSSEGTELSLMIQEQGNGNATIGQSQARMLVDWAVAATAGDSDPTVMGILSTRKMHKLLENASLELDSKKKATLKDTYQRPVRGIWSELFSAVNLVFLSNTNTEHLDSSVTFAFSHHPRTEEGAPKTPGHREELICAFWKSDDRGGGHWNTTGCSTLGTRNDSTTCQCSHLSSFAILLAHYDIVDPKLALITKVGLALSLVCLLLCILTFLLVRPIQGSRTTVHLHLCLCLFLGSAIFLAGIENEGGELGPRCRLVAGLLHYCFLAAFCWMTLEGLELYFLVVLVFQGQGLSKRWLYLIGYGVPLLIVGISVAARKEGYGQKLYCWLNRENGFLWSFQGPVIFIILCNAIIFVITVWKLMQKFSEVIPDMKKLKKARVLTVTAVAQLFVLGTTWVFGLFLFDPLSWESWVLSYVFTVLNCLQGFFLYILHCLLNKKVREEYRRWAGWITGNKYSEFSTSSSNQTQAHRPSESGM
ncbi:CD97 antigen isoform X5 [Suricata suricatta]|uniref:CD97 antigen isoform X5 n=1 Tax=Suricata suricatta TaxID=37032 RepID=UPI0011553C6A|nr:CD97 antigen isoform X5 [Suricata suricatta]